MDLAKFQIENFRSINDSGEITVDRMTSLVGRNESGKSNLLIALATLNPPGGRKGLNKIKDFPRGRRLEECDDNTQVVRTWWRLAKNESETLEETLGYGPSVTQVEVGRRYGTALWVGLGVPDPVLDVQGLATIISGLTLAFEPGIAALEEPHRNACQGALNKLKDTLDKSDDQKAWASAAVPAMTDLRKHLSAAGLSPDQQAVQLLEGIDQRAKISSGFEAAQQAARNLVVTWLPTFIYVSEFPELYGHQNLDQFNNHRGQDPTRKEAEDNFAKMAKVAGFDPKFLQTITNDHETRNQLLNRAGALVTQEIRRLWKDRALKVRFHLDGIYFDTFVSDPNAVYDVEVNLDERSRGFRWFFAFYVTFAADTQGGNAAGAVLLLDEPGLHLHARSQEDLLNHLRHDFKNQIIYTTHSPFMVPADAIEIVRTVNINADRGTTVTDSPTGDSRTLFPLQAALGYHLSQTLFVGPSNLVVEGVTDFWILSSVSAHFSDNGTTTLPDDLTITPAGGAGKVSYMAALLASEELKVLVLLDDDKAGREARDDLVANKLLREGAITFVTEAFDPPPKEADTEDLIDSSVYADLVTHTYQKELTGKTLKLNQNLPRIVKQYEDAFGTLGLTFHKTRPAREFITRMASNATSTLPAASAARFEALFKIVRARFDRIVALQRDAFK